jgi:ectoine hydroxylase-related dioxygenase (phytanoyl-CoA dioxygenase family)
VLFFGGFTIHGSYPNRTPDRFRRAFIVHYFGAHLETLQDDPGTSMAGLKTRLAEAR